MPDACYAAIPSDLGGLPLPRDSAHSKVCINLHLKGDSCPKV